MELTRMTLAVDDGLARLTFTYAERGNPIDGIFCAEMAEVGVRLSEDRSVRCVLMAAEGKAFGIGGDISTFVNDLDRLPSNIKRWTTTLHSAVARLQRMDAPIVAAVHGVCAGGMVALVAGADIVVAAEDTRFVPAFANIGFSSDSGSTIMYTRRMGAARARKFLLLGETMGAEEALATGLVDEVRPADAFAARAEEIARRLAAGPTRAYGEVRRLFLTVTDQPLETQLELEAQALSRMSGTDDAREGIGAFAERRPPNFKGV